MSVSPEYPLDEISDDWYWGIGEVVGESKTFPFHKDEKYRGTIYTDKNQDWSVELIEISVNEHGEVSYKERIEHCSFLSYGDAMEYVTEITEKYNNE